MTELLCVCKNCPNKERCVHYIDNTHIKQFPAIYVVTDMSRICDWYKRTKGEVEK